MKSNNTKRKLIDLDIDYINKLDKLARKQGLNGAKPLIELICEQVANKIIMPDFQHINNG